MAFLLASAALLASNAPLALASDPSAIAQPEMATSGSQQPASVPAGAPSAPAEAKSPSAGAETIQQPPTAGTDIEPEQEPEPQPAEGGNVIVVSAEARDPLKDPLEQVNTAAFQITQDVDKALVAPIADAYEDDLPSPMRKGLRNFFRNLMEPVNALNFLFQLKPGKAFETLGRFTINTTAGVAGLFDIAKRKPINLPYRRNGFGNTLGYYGVGPGPFLILPLVGATTLRDLIGSGLDQAVLPFAVGKPFGTPLYAIPAYTVNSLEFRIDFDEKLEQINTSDDPYYAMREFYLCQREADIAKLKNRPPPRDCSIEAIMAGPEPVAPVAMQPVEPVVEESAAESVAEPAAEPAPPAIEYISREVVQPLPAG